VASQVDILEGGGSHDGYGVLVIQSPTNGSSSVNRDTAAATADQGCPVTTAAAVGPVSAANEAADDDRRWLGRHYKKQLSIWDSICSKLLFA